MATIVTSWQYTIGPSRQLRYLRGVCEAPTHQHALISRRRALTTRDATRPCAVPFGSRLNPATSASAASHAPRRRRRRARTPASLRRTPCPGPERAPTRSLGAGLVGAADLGVGEAETRPKESHRKPRISLPAQVPRGSGGPAVADVRSGLGRPWRRASPSRGAGTLDMGALRRTKSIRDRFVFHERPAAAWPVRRLVADPLYPRPFTRLNASD